MKKVYICSPLGGDVDGNLIRAKEYTAYALRCGVAPVTPHFYALCIDDSNIADRQLGLSAGLSLLMMCDEVWVFGDRISDGMRDEIKAAKNINLRIRKITDGEIYETGGYENDENQNGSDDVWQTHCEM